MQNKSEPEDKAKTNTGSHNRGTVIPESNGGLLSANDLELLHSEKKLIQPELPKEKTILVADDDDFNFFVIETLLAPYNYRIIHAKDGEEAVRIFKTQKISLVLMDIQMPVMDGITATKQIRKFDKKVPVIAQTACIIDDVKEMAIDSGCNDFFTKPLNSELLIHKIEKYLNN
ncbi:MAG: response regulator [Prolixibacteraceae bacterium]